MAQFGEVVERERLGSDNLGPARPDSLGLEPMPNAEDFLGTCGRGGSGVGKRCGEEVWGSGVEGMCKGVCVEGGGRGAGVNAEVRE